MDHWQKWVRRRRSAMAIERWKKCIWVQSEYVNKYYEINFFGISNHWGVINTNDLDNTSYSKDDGLEVKDRGVRYLKTASSTQGRLVGQKLRV
jgi:hypothetical protein